MGNTLNYFSQYEYKKLIRNDDVENIDARLQGDERLIGFAIYYSCKHSKTKTALHILNKYGYRHFYEVYTKTNALYFCIKNDLGEIVKEIINLAVKSKCDIGLYDVVVGEVELLTYIINSRLELVPILIDIIPSDYDIRDGHYPSKRIINYLIMWNNEELLCDFLEKNKEINSLPLMDPLFQASETCSDSICVKICNKYGYNHILLDKIVKICLERDLTKTLKNIFYEETICKLEVLEVLKNNHRQLQNYLSKVVIKLEDEDKICSFLDDNAYSLSSIIVLIAEKSFTSILKCKLALSVFIEENREDLAIKLIELGFKHFETSLDDKPVYFSALEKKMSKLVFLLENKYVHKQNRDCLICQSLIKDKKFQYCMKPTQHFS